MANQDHGVDPLGLGGQGTLWIPLEATRPAAEKPTPADPMSSPMVAKVPPTVGDEYVPRVKFFGEYIDPIEPAGEVEQ